MEATPVAGGCHGGAAAQNAQAGGGVGHEARVQVGPGGPEGQGDRQAFLDDKVENKLKELLEKGDSEGAESLRRIFSLLPSGQQRMKGGEGSEKLGEAVPKVHDEVSSSHRVPTPLGGQELGGKIRQLDRGTLAFRAQLQQKQAAGEALHAPGQHALKGPVEQLLLEAVEREDWGGPVGRDQANAVLMLGLQQGQHALENAVMPPAVNPGYRPSA